MVWQIGKMMSDVGFLGAFLETLILIALGFVFRKRGLITPDAKQAFTTFVWKIAVPCMAFGAFMTDFDGMTFHSGMWVLLAAAIVYAVIFFLVRLAFRRRGRETATLCGLFCAIGQVTLFAMPVLQSIYADRGAEALIPISMVTIAFRVMVYIVAFFIISGAKIDRGSVGASLKKICLNPIIIAMVAGMLIWLTQSKLPQVHTADGAYAILRLDKTLPALYKTVTAVAKTVCPLSMFLIGLSLGEGDLGEAVGDPLAWLLGAIRTLLAPVVTLLVICLLQLAGLTHFGEYEVMSLVLGMAAPMSATVNIYCIQFRRQELLASKVCLMSTLLCLLTIPLCYLLVHTALTLPVF